MNEQQIKELIGPHLLAAQAITVTPDWLVKFAMNIMQAVPRPVIQYQGAPAQLAKVYEPSKPKKAPTVDEGDQVPPPGAISHDDILKIIKARRQVHSNKELAKIIGCDPAMLYQVVTLKTPVSKKVALGLGFKRHTINGQYWFEQIEQQPQPKPKPAQQNEKPPSLVQANHDGMPRIIRSSPFEGAPAVRNPGPFQQLLDAQGGAAA